MPQKRTTGLRYNPNLPPETSTTDLEFIQPTTDPRFAVDLAQRDVQSAFPRGLRSGFQGAVSGSQAYLANALEVAGQDQAAQNLYAASDERSIRAGIAAPRVQDYRDINDAGDALDFGVGAAGQAISSTLPAMAAIGLTRGRVAPYLAGAATMLPQEAGESVRTLRADPEAMKLPAAQRFAISTGKGAVSAAAETLVPFALQKRLGLRLPASAPRAAGELLGAAGVEGVTEGVQTKVGQLAHGVANPNRNTSGDTHEIINAALAGAAGGAGIAAPYVAASTTLDVLQDVGAFAKRGADRALDAGQELGKKGIEAGGSILDEVKAKAGEAIDLAQTGMLLSEADSVPPEILAQGQESVAIHLDQQDAQKNQFVKDRLTHLANTGHQRAQEILTTLGTPETYTQARDYVANAYKSSGISEKLKSFADTALSAAEGFIAKPGTAPKVGEKKSNAQLTSFQRLALDEMLAATPPDIAQSEGFQSAAPYLINSLARLDDRVPPQIRRQAAAEFAQLYGDGAFELAAKIGELAARDNPNIDPGFVERDLRKQLSDGLARQKSGLEVVKKNLTTDGIVALQGALGTKLDDSHLSTLNDTLARRAASGKSTADAQLKQIFGANLSRVENFYRALHENDSQSESRAVQKDESDVTDGEVETSDEQDFVERQAAKAAGAPILIGKKDSPTLFDKAFPKAIEERIAKERLKDATLEYAAVPAEQAIKEAGLDPAKFGDLSGKSVIRGYAVTDNNEATVLTARDVAELSSESDVVRDAGGKQNADDTAFTDKAGVKKLRRKARASDGVIHFETEDGKTVSIPAYKLAFTMTGRLRSSATGETSQIDALHAGVSSLLGGEMKRAYVIDDKGVETDLSTPGAYESVRLGKGTVGESPAQKKDAVKRVVSAKKKSGVDTAVEEEQKQGAQITKAELIAEAASRPLLGAAGWLAGRRREGLETQHAAGRSDRRRILRRAGKLVELYGNPPDIRKNLTAEQKQALKVDKNLWVYLRAQALKQWGGGTERAAKMFDYIYGENGISNLSERARVINATMPQLERIIEARRNGEQFDALGNPENDDTDTSSDFLDSDKLEAEKRIEEITDAAKNLQTTTRAQGRPVPKLPTKEAKDKLAAMQRAAPGQVGEKKQNAQKAGAEVTSINKRIDEKRQAQFEDVAIEIANNSADGATGISGMVSKRLEVLRSEIQDAPTNKVFTDIVKRKFVRAVTEAGKYIAAGSPFEAREAYDELDSSWLDWEEARAIGESQFAQSSLFSGLTVPDIKFTSARAGRGYNFDLQRSGTPIATDEQVAEAKAYVEKTLGNEIKLIFEKDLGGISGEWERGAADNIIRLALNAGPGVLSIAHHEAMHEFFDRLTKSGKENVKSVLLNAANSSTVSRQLERLLANEPAALKQIKADPEERLAYMYQFWAAGRLTVGPKTEGVFAKIKAFFRKITGLISTDERAEAILAAFHGGQTAEISATGRVLDEIMARGSNSRAVIAKLKPVYQKAYAVVMPSTDLLEDSENPHFIEAGNRFFTPLVGESGDTWGLLNANRAISATWTNRFGNSIHGLNGEEIELLRETLSTGKASNFAPVDAAAKEIKQTLKDFREYMVGRGIKIGNRKDYFPRVWDFEKVAGDIEGFKSMLTTHYPDKFPNAEAAEALTHRMSLLGGVEQEGKPAEEEDAAGFTPFMQAVNKMKLDFIQDEHAQAFLNDDLVEIMTSYLKQGVHRAEYESRMGEGGVELEALITKAVEWETARELEKSELSAEFKKLSAAHGESKAIDELRTSATLSTQFIEIEKAAKVRAQTLVTAVHAMEGTIGHDKVSPAWRKFSSWMIVYQNFRLLPLQLFSSMIDPLGFVVRGGKAGDAFDAMKSGFQEVLNTWTGKEMTRDDKTRLAELLGTIEHQTFLSSLGNTHESMYMTRGARKISGALFKYNGMEGWNRAMRVSATTVAVSFIKEHATGAGDHSVRWIKELGLKAADVKLDANGEVVLFKEGFEALGMSKEESAIAANKMQRAVNQWVDGAMLRPNAALRPAWSSDPRWGLVFYLKQFTYAFQKTFLARVRNEYMHGNLTPALAMMPFIPTMIAADVLRGLLQNGGELPNYMQGWGPGDYLMHGVQRASLLGIGQLPIDQLNHPTDVVGPVAQQAVDVFTQPVDETLYEATPGLALVR